MANYRMTPARRAALEKAQAASARKRRKLANRSRTARLVNRKTLALVTTAAVGGIAAHTVVSEHRENEFATDPINELIISRHVEVARYQNLRLNELRALGIPPQSARPFSEKAARREAIAILRRKKKKRL